MKKIILIAVLLVYCSSYAQKTTIKANTIKEKYKNFFYRTTDKYSNKVQPFNVSSIIFSTSYLGSKEQNVYQISIKGKVNNNKESIVYNARSIEEFEYYKKAFNGKYKKVDLFKHGFYVDSKKVYNTSISIQF
jgi:hypothetical protein